MHRFAVHAVTGGHLFRLTNPITFRTILFSKDNHKPGENAKLGCMTATSVGERDPALKFETLYEKIRTRICLLQYPPGMALREEALASEFGVSRTPIRQVLHRLEFEGLVDHRRGAGSLVTIIDLRSLKEVYELRLKRTEFTGEMMSPHILETEFARLEDLAETCQGMHDKYQPMELARLYYDFNKIITQLISNKPLRRISDQLFHQTARVWLEILPDLDWDEEVDYIYDEIKQVIKHLRAGELQAVAQVRRDHLAMLLRRINAYLGSADINGERNERR